MLSGKPADEIPEENTKFFERWGHILYKVWSTEQEESSNLGFLKKQIYSKCFVSQ